MNPSVEGTQLAARERMTKAQSKVNDELWEIKWHFDEAFSEVHHAKRCEFRDAVMTNIQSAALLVRDALRMIEQDA